MQEFQVQDGERVIQFKGEELASVTSRERKKMRWIELALYRTEAGTYVLAGRGCTLVQNEVERRWVQIAGEPDGIINRLTMYNDDGAEYIPHTSKRLLEIAAQRDEEIRQSYMVQRVA